MRKNILVTGAHRSGSTWTGKILSHSKNVRYIHEPFNLNKLTNSPPLTYWFEYINENSEVEKQAKVKSYLNSYLSRSINVAIMNLLEVKSVKDIYRFSKDYITRMFNEINVIKDPIAFFSTEWIYKNFDCDVVIIIRHPAAFIASLKVKDWQFDFNNLLNQQNLIDELLITERNNIVSYSKKDHDIVMQGILLWKIFYSTVIDFKKKYPSWYYIKHEDLSSDPVLEFQKLYEYLDLQFDDKVRMKIFESTTSSKKTKLKRNSKQNIKSWKDRLTIEEIELIKQNTYPIWKEFYTEKDWE